jgi:hypothetical protein
MTIDAYATLLPLVSLLFGIGVGYVFSLLLGNTGSDETNDRIIADTAEVVNAQREIVDKQLMMLQDLDIKIENMSANISTLSKTIPRQQE